MGVDESGDKHFSLRFGLPFSACWPGFHGAGGCLVLLRFECLVPSARVISRGCFALCARENIRSLLGGLFGIHDFLMRAGILDFVLEISSDGCWIRKNESNCAGMRSSWDGKVVAFRCLECETKNLAGNRKTTLDSSLCASTIQDGLCLLCGFSAGVSSHIAVGIMGPKR